MTSIPSLALNDGHSIPQIGLGTWPLDDDEAERTVLTAFELGYRHVDTARRYGNEAGVGRGVTSSGIPREDVFVTTKLDGEFQGGDKAVDGLRGSLELMGLDYVDLLLIHWPLPAREEYVSTWRTFAKLRDQGLVRSIGVSNFLPAHLDRLKAETGIVPAVNQIQLTPAIPRHAQRAYGLEHGIVTESWSPIKGILDESIIVGIAEELDVTPAQVVLRWHVQNKLVAIPKSADRGRLASNLDVFGFELSTEQMGLLTELDQGPDAGVDSSVDGH